MRIFSSFAVLGLLYIARGGELDSFSGDSARQIRENLRDRNSSSVSGFSDSDPSPPSNAPPDLPPAFQKVQERSEHHNRTFDKLDTNSDGYIDAGGILKSLEFWLGDAHSVRRVLRTFGIQEIDETMEGHTPGSISPPCDRVFANSNEYTNRKNGWPNPSFSTLRNVGQWKVANKVLTVRQFKTR